MVSFQKDDFAFVFAEDTTSGGTLSVEGNRVVLETGSYAAGDPRCCPSGVLRETIGWDAETKHVKRLDANVTPVTS